MEDEVHVAGLTILGDNLHVILDVLEEVELLQEECSAAVSNVSAENQICDPNSRSNKLKNVYDLNVN